MTESEESVFRATARAQAALKAWLDHPLCDEYPDDNPTMMADMVADLLLLSVLMGIPYGDTVERAASYVDMDAEAAIRLSAASVAPDDPRDELVRAEVRRTVIDHYVTCTKCGEDIFCTHEDRHGAVENAEFFGWVLDVENKRVLCPRCQNEEEQLAD